MRQVSGKDERPVGKEPEYYVQEDGTHVYGEERRGRRRRFNSDLIKNPITLICVMTIIILAMTVGGPEKNTPYYVIECEVAADITEPINIHIVKESIIFNDDDVEDILNTMTNNKINSSMRVQSKSGVSITFVIKDIFITLSLENDVFDNPFIVIVYGIEYTLFAELLFHSYGYEEIK